MNLEKIRRKQTDVQYPQIFRTLIHEYIIFPIKIYLISFYYIQLVWEEYQSYAKLLSMMATSFSAGKGTSRLNNNQNSVAEQSLKTSCHHTLTTRTDSLDSLKKRRTHITLLVTENIPVTWWLWLNQCWCSKLISLTQIYKIKINLDKEESRADIWNNFYLLKALAKKTHPRTPTAN